MAKIRLTSPTFDASAKTVVHSSFSDVTLAGIQLIVNVTDQIIIYNFADTTKGGTLVTDTLTLEYDTTTMDDTDELMILVEDGIATQAVTGTVTANIGTVSTLATAAKQDTGNASLATLAGAVAGTEVQVDIVTMPTVTVNTHAVTATDLDIRNLVNTDVVTAELSATDNAVLDSIAASVASIDADTSTIITSVQLIDDTVATLGTTTYTEASSKGIVIGAVRRDADTPLVDTTNEVSPLITNAIGALKVEVFSGETLPVSVTSTTITGTVAVTQSGTWDEIGINDSGNSITVDNPQLSVVGSGTEATALRVTIATDSTGVVSVDDNGGSITVDAAAGGLVIGDGTTPVVVLSAGADDTANTENQLVTAAMGYVYDGATWDRLPGNSTDGALVNLGANNDVTVTSGTITTVSTVTSVSQNADIRQSTASNLNAQIVGNVAHDGVDSGNPVAVGFRAIAHGSNPTAVAAADRTAAYANRAGIPFMIGGHPNIINKEFTILDSDGAQTDAALITVSAGTKIVVTKIGAYAHNANTVSVNVRIGFGTATIPAAALAGATGIVLSHPKIAPGSGVVEGNGGGIIGIGGDDEDLRITCDDPVTGSIRVLVTYYTIES